MKNKKLLETINKLIGLSTYKPIQEQTNPNPCFDFFNEMSPSMAGLWNPANGPIQPGSNTVPHGDVDCCEMLNSSHGEYTIFIFSAPTLNALSRPRLFITSTEPLLNTFSASAICGTYFG